MSTGNKYKLSDSFEKFLAEISEGLLTSEKYEQIYTRFEDEAKNFFFTLTSEANLIRILSSIYDKKSFLLDSLKYEHHIEIVCAISSLSNYLTDVVVRNPEYLYLLFDQQFLSSKIDKDKLQIETSNSVNNFKNLKSKTKMLRNIKRKYLLKIGVSDILDFSDLETTTSHLSILANVLSSILFDVCFKEIQIKYDVVLEESYALCSLGKLGGNELNYSSDIDLILFYEKNFEIPGIKKEFHELISEALTLFIKEATAVTPESYLYRVDFRLRPDGRNSLLCRTETDYLKYYETRGEDWERQMLIKLGFVGGDIELFNHFKNYLNGFIYPKTLRNSVFETIRKMKRSIESRLRDDKNIKLIPGGIRDVEFSIQTLQLVNGGKNPQLKTGNSLQALRELRKIDLISDEEFAHLNEAYILYRKIEHFVQLMNDKQTHSIPDSPEVAEKLSMFLEHDSTESLESEIEKQKKFVREIYESITGTEVIESNDDFISINFSEKTKAKNNIEFLRHGLSLIGEKQFDSNTVKLFQDIEPTLFEYLKNCSYPDIVLENFTRIIKNTKIPSVWYSAFGDELFFKSFLKICFLSQRAIDSMVTSPKLADLFLSKKVFDDIQQDDKSLNLNETLFILSVQHVNRIISFPEFSNALRSKLEKNIISIISGFDLDYNFFVAGLGSFGSSELSFGSDIDLIVVTEKAEDNPQAQKDFQKILNEIQKKLKPFEVDFRLRPEGKSSPLVWDIAGYKKYVDTRMRVWEFQALSKLKLIYGSEELFKQLVQLASEKLNSLDNEIVTKEIMQMYRSKLSFSSTNRKKTSFKSSPGALLTLDTIISLLVLKEVELYERLIGANSLTKFEKVISSYELPELEKVKNNYIVLKNFQTGLQNLFNQSKSTLPGNNDKVNMLSKYFGYEDAETFWDILDKVLKENATLLNNILDR